MIGFGGKCRVSEKPERSQAIIGAHHHQARTRKRRSELIALAVTSTIRAAMKEDDYGLLVPGRHLPGPFRKRQSSLQ